MVLLMHRFAYKIAFLLKLWSGFGFTSMSVVTDHNLIHQSLNRQDVNVLRLPLLVTLITSCQYQNHLKSIFISCKLWLTLKLIFYSCDETELSRWGHLTHINNEIIRFVAVFDKKEVIFYKLKFINEFWNFKRI